MSDDIPLNSKKIILYYFIYSFLFIVLHMGVISVFSFFHFLLDHDLNTIELWLSRNAWEIVIFAKLLSFFGCFYLLRMNNYKKVSISLLLSKMKLKPSIKVASVILFILVCFYFLLVETTRIVNIGSSEPIFTYTSFIGASIFFSIEFGMIYILEFYYEPKPKSFKIRLLSLLTMFIFSIKLSIIDLPNIYIVFVLHFVSMYYFCRRKFFTNGVLYSIFVVGILSAVFGFDMVWGNEFAYIKFDRQPPLLGIIGVWLIALSYYHKSTID